MSGLSAPTMSHSVTPTMAKYSASSVAEAIAERRLRSARRCCRRKMSGVATAMPMLSPTSSGTAARAKSSSVISLVPSRSAPSSALERQDAAVPAASRISTSRTWLRPTSRCRRRRTTTAAPAKTAAMVSGHETDDRPGELGAQHKDLGQQHACKQDAGVGRPAEDQHGEKCAEAGVPGRHRQTIVLVDEAHPFEGEIDGKQYAGSGGLGQKRADRGKQLVDLPVPLQAGEIPSEKRYCQGVGPKWSVGGAEDIVSERVHQHARRPAVFTAMCCAVPIGRSPVTGTMIPLRSRRRYSICWRRSWASLRLANCMARAYTMHRPYGGRPSAERAKPTIVTVD